MCSVPKLKKVVRFILILILPGLLCFLSLFFASQSLVIIIELHDKFTKLKMYTHTVPVLKILLLLVFPSGSNTSIVSQVSYKILV